MFADSAGMELAVVNVCDNLHYSRHKRWYLCWLC
jgi:hypothetical protein